MNRFEKIVSIVGLLIIVIGCIPAAIMGEDNFDRFVNSKYYNTEFYKQTQIEHDEYVGNKKYRMLHQILDAKGGFVNISDYTVVSDDVIYYIMIGVPYAKNTLVVSDEDEWEYRLDGVVSKVPNLHKKGLSEGYKNAVVFANSGISLFDPTGLDYVKPYQLLF